MDIDLLIENGVIVVPKMGLFKGCLGIAGEKIVGVDTSRNRSAKASQYSSGTKARISLSRSTSSRTTSRLPRESWNAFCTI